MDEALWDIKGKRAGMPVYEMLGGRAHDAVACYDHVSGRTKEQAAEVVAKSMENGFRHIRLQYGEGGYGGGGFIRPTKAAAPRAATRARRSMKTCTSRPFRRCSSMSAPRWASRPNCCTTSTRTSAAPTPSSFPRRWSPTISLLCRRPAPTRASRLVPGGAQSLRHAPGCGRGLLQPRQNITR